MAGGVGRNVVWSVASWLVPMVVTFFALPVTVRGLGDEVYGVVALSGAVVGYLGVLDVGMNLGVTRYMAMFAALRHGRAMRGLLRLVIVWFLLVGVLGAIVAWLLAPWLVREVLDIPTVLTERAVVAFRLAGIAFGLSSLAGILSAVPAAFLRYDLQSILRIVVNSATILGPAILVMLGQGLLAVMWFSVVASGAALLSWGAIAGRLVQSVPDEGPTFAEYRPEFVHFCKPVALNRAFSAVQSPTSRMVVGMAGGAAQAAYYQVPQTLSYKITELLMHMNVVLLPTGSKMAADGQRGDLVSLYMRSSRLFYLLNASVVGAVVVFSEPLLRHWVGPQYAQQGEVAFILLTLSAGLNAVGMTSSQLRYALGRPKITLAFSLVNSAINLGTLYGLTVAFGITGTALSDLLAAGVVPFALWYTHRKVFRISTWPVVRDCYLRTTLVVLTVGVVAWVLLRPLAASLLLTMILAAAFVLVSVSTSAGAGVVSRADWQAVRSMLRAPRSKSAHENLVSGEDDSDVQ